MFYPDSPKSPWSKTYRFDPSRGFGSRVALGFVYIYIYICDFILSGLSLELYLLVILHLHHKNN